jgi:2-hydroxy-3-oxopropionate reductase
MLKTGFIGLGVMGLHMALNLNKYEGSETIAYDIREDRRRMYEEAGGTAVTDIEEIYRGCDVIFQMLPTHETIINSVKEAMRLGKNGAVIVDMSSAAPDLIISLEEQVRNAGMHLLDSPVSGGNPMAIAGTLSIMTGGEREVFDRIRPLLGTMGSATYTGPSGSGDAVKIINNMIGGAMLAVISEAYALAEKSGLNLDTVFEATRGGFAGGPLYENKVPKIINRDFKPGARIAVHYKDILNAVHYAEKAGADITVTMAVKKIMGWMMENGYADEDQAAMIRYYEQRNDYSFLKER